ncbi:MAG: PIN domain-containing protein, partial [Isosphaeraceae bacterium]
PGEIVKLQRFRQALDEIIGIGVQVIPITQQHVLLAADLSLQHSLLSGDALIAAVMHYHRLTSLASNDSDFERVPGIVRYAPIA